MPVRAFAKRVISEVLRTLCLGIGCLSEAVHALNTGPATGVRFPVL
jgi:hypothetical protein